jgi:hypothetical protein
LDNSYAVLDLESLSHCTDLASLDVNSLHTTVASRGYGIVRGLFDEKAIAASVALLRERFTPTDDHAAQGEARELVRTNFQKLGVGGASLRYNNFPRFFRTFYNPMWCEDIYQMHRNFRTLIRLRNKIYGIREDFAARDSEENGLWSATRVHQYPAGGGFFYGHRDTTLLDVAREKNTNFYQLVLTMTEKGRDFSSGGAFVDNNDKRHLIEDICKPGDVLVYDGRSHHGVEDIDSHLPLDLSRLNGRIVAMASLYSL